jgi:hypothetical protein
MLAVNTFAAGGCLCPRYQGHGGPNQCSRCTASQGAPQRCESCQTAPARLSHPPLTDPGGQQLQRAEVSALHLLQKH